MDSLFERIDAGDIELTGDGGLIPSLIKAALERGLQAELTDDLGYEKRSPEAPLFPKPPNGSTPKTLASQFAEIDLDVPRDREGSFTPDWFSCSEFDDEDENELRLRVGDPDKDDDDILDGDEDADHDGEANEDEDDDAEDRCDFDGDGESDEDQGDLFGAIDSFDSVTGVLVVTSVAGYTITSVVDADIKVELEKPEGFQGDFDNQGSTSDLVIGAQVAELELDEETSSFDKVKVYPAA